MPQCTLLPLLEGHVLSGLRTWMSFDIQTLPSPPVCLNQAYTATIVSHSIRASFLKVPWTSGYLTLQFNFIHSGMKSQVVIRKGKKNRKFPKRNVTFLSPEVSSNKNRRWLKWRAQLHSHKLGFEYKLLAPPIASCVNLSFKKIQSVYINNLYIMRLL